MNRLIGTRFQTKGKRLTYNYLLPWICRPLVILAPVDTPKRMRQSDCTESLTPTSDLLDPAIDLLSNTEQYPISYAQIVEFLEEAGEEKDYFFNSQVHC